MGGMGPIDDGARYRFGPFDLDTHTGELRKHGVRIQLQNQPFQILALLVARSGEIVPRVEIQGLLWPDNTTVEFDHGINAAIRRLRVALGDSAEEPHYIETVARRGYRFLVPVVRDRPSVHPDAAEAAALPAPSAGIGEEPDEPVADPRPGTPEERPATGRTLGRVVSRTAYLISAAALVIVVLSAAFILHSRAPVRLPNQASSVSIPPGFRIVGRPVISPDGSQLAAALDGAARQRQLWVVPLATGAGRFLPGTEGASGPIWAPDGRYLGFVAGNEFKRVSLASGLVRRIYAAISSAPGAWAADGTILYCPGPRMPIFVLDSDHGTVPATRREPGETLGHISPHFVDGGRRFVFLAPGLQPDKSAVYAASLGSLDRRLLLTDAAEIGFAPPDTLLYLRDGVLLARRFDFSSGVPIGPERQVQLGIDGQHVSTFTVSRNGALVVQLAPPHPESDLVWRTREGKIISVVGAPGVRWQVTLAPDESAAAINLPGRTGSAHLDLLRFGASPFNLTGEGTHVLDAVWSPDSRSIAYQIYGREKTVIMVRRLDQPEPRVLLDDGFSNYPDDWSPDGRWILCRRTANIVFTIAPDGAGGPHILLNGDHILDELKFSPDGKWIAYNSDESGRTDVYLARFPQMDEARQISRAGGCQPLWRKDGKELFYLDQDGNLFSVAFPQGPASKASAPRMLFQSGVVTNSIISQYAVTADGKRFLMLELHAGSEHESSDGPLVLVKNWAARQQ